MNPPGQQVGPVVDRGHPVEDVVAGFLYIVSHLILKGEHSLGVQKAGAGDEVALVGVLPGQLVADEVAAVVEILPVHPVILHRVPAGGLHLADLSPGLGGHERGAEVGIGRPAAPQGIQRSIGLKGFGGVLLLGKVRLVAVELHPGLLRPELSNLHLPQVHRRLCPPGTACQQQAP